MGGIYLLISVGYILKVQMVNYGIYMFSLRSMTKLVSKVFLQIYSLTICVLGFWLFHNFDITYYFCLLHFSHSGGYVMVFHCGLIRICLIINKVGYHLTYILTIWISSFIKCLLMSFANFSIGLSAFFLLINRGSLYSLLLNTCFRKMFPYL